MSTPIAGSVPAKCYSSQGTPRPGGDEHMFTIEVQNRTFRVRAFNVFGVHEGLLEGCPMDVMNDAAIATALKKAQEQHPTEPIHLVEPPRTEIEDGGPASFLRLRGAKRYERIPPWCWILQVDSEAIGSGDGSSGVVVVFTESMTELPGPLVETFGGVPWTTFARDWEF